MKNINELEKKYLDAKISYYEGQPILPDAVFDSLEKILKEAGSKAIEQVGSKRKDFNYNHPSKMLSLKKIQTDEKNTKFIEFLSWYNKRADVLKSIFNIENDRSLIYISPKFDGNAINIIFKGNKLYHILTRGDGKFGKNITNKLKLIIPNTIKYESKENDFLEIRCEVVIDKDTFYKKYSEFANPRNYVAGVLGADNYNEEVIKDLTIIPLYYILNGKHLYPDEFVNNFESKNFYIFPWVPCLPINYENHLVEWINQREKFPYQLDGIVITFLPEYRKILGENEHDTEYCISVKFIPKDAITEVEGIEWNTAKNGELIPTVLLKPVFLDGSTVRRASGYNAGYVLKNRVGPGAIISLIKSGDIIPEIQKVITPSTESPINLFPDECLSCGSKTFFNSVHLICVNDNCVGRIAKQLAGAVKLLELKGIGEKTIEPFAEDFKNMFEIIGWVRSSSMKEIDKYGIKFGSRSHEIFANAFKNIKSLTYTQVIQMLGYDNVGEKISIQLAREHAGLNFDYANLERALVAKLRSPEVSGYIKAVVAGLESMGITIDKPKKQISTMETIYVCMTGSPSPVSKTKEEFISQFDNTEQVSITDARCNYLITNSLDSMTSKMKNAEKKGVKIITYEDFANKFNSL